MVNVSAKQTTLDDMILRHDLEQFLYLEARLLDERRLTEWLDLLDDDLDYWMPMRRNIKFGDWDREFTDHHKEINWFDETKDILAGRIRQLETGVHWPEEPVSRFEHLITNVEVAGERYHRSWDGELLRRDQIRNERLMELGWDIMRFWVYQVRDELEGCVSRVRAWRDMEG